MPLVDPARMVVSASILAMSGCGLSQTDHTMRVEVEWEMPDDLLPVHLPRPGVFVTVTGHRSVLRDVASTSPTLVASLDGYPAGEHRVDLSAMPVQGLPPEVEVSSMTPSTTMVHLDEVALQEVRVTASLLGEVDEAHQLEKVEVVPDEVVLRGPRAALDNLVEVQLEPIDISDMSRSVELQGELDLPRMVHVVRALDPEAAEQTEWVRSNEWAAVRLVVVPRDGGRGENRP